MNSGASKASAVPPLARDSPSRILVVGPVPPPFGGIARYVQDLLESELSRNFHLHHFNTSFSAKVRSHAVNPGHRRYQSEGHSGWLKYGYVFSNGAMQGLRTLVAGILSVPLLAGHILLLRPQLVHIFANMHWGFWRAGAMALVARLLGRNVVFHPLGAIDQFYPSCGPAGRFLVRFLLNRADLILVQSPGLAKLVQVMTRRPVEGVFNGIDLLPFDGSEFSRPLTESELARKGPVYLAVGDLGHNKGTWDILTSASAVKKAHPDAQFWFIGRGELADLQQRARAAGVEGAVTFLGSISDAEKMIALRQADVFLLPSYGEGQPLSILEAMAAGLPVISTPVGSIAEVIAEEKNGLLVQPGDIHSLEKAMVRLGQDRTLRLTMGKQNRADAQERFSASRLWQDLDACWRQVIGRNYL